MSTPIGTVVWRDLTAPDAEGLRDFYRDVVGWQPEAVPMGDYADFAMNDAKGEAVAGICHSRGVNADLPAQWLVYVQVADVEASAARCVERGGAVIAGPRAMGAQRLCIIRDPAGAVMALVSGQ